FSLHAVVVQSGNGPDGARGRGADRRKCPASTSQTDQSRGGLSCDQTPCARTALQPNASRPDRHPTPGPLPCLARQPKKEQKSTQIEEKLRAEAAKMGADAVIIVFDRVQPMGAY